MTFTFGWALAILVVMYYVSSVLSTKTRARIGTMIFFSVFILIGYWTIFPADIIATSQIPVVAAITNLVLQKYFSDPTVHSSSSYIVP